MIISLDLYTFSGWQEFKSSVYYTYSFFDSIAEGLLQVSLFSVKHVLLIL